MVWKLLGSDQNFTQTQQFKVSSFHSTTCLFLMRTFYQDGLFREGNWEWVLVNFQITMLILLEIYDLNFVFIRRRGVVGRVPAFQPCNPGSIPGGVRNLNPYPGIVCVSFVFCPVLSPAEALTLCWLHIQGGPPLCICLVFWSIDNCSSYRHLTHGHLGCKS